MSHLPFRLVVMAVDINPDSPSLRSVPPPLVPTAVGWTVRSMALPAAGKPIDTDLYLGMDSDLYSDVKFFVFFLRL